MLANRADRDGVFDALQARRCYTVTGPRILVDLTLEGHPMGSELRGEQLNGPPALALEVNSAHALDRIEIYRNAYRADTIVCSGRREQLTWVDPKPLDGQTVSYFAKIRRVDQECAWTSPTWVN